MLPEDPVKSRSITGTSAGAPPSSIPKKWYLLFWPRLLSSIVFFPMRLNMAVRTFVTPPP